MMLDACRGEGGSVQDGKRPVSAHNAADARPVIPQMDDAPP